MSTNYKEKGSVSKSEGNIRTNYYKITGSNIKTSPKTSTLSSP